jgi:hypothetical protein
LKRLAWAALVAAFVLALGGRAPLSALTIRAGLAYGPRSINDALLTTIYHPGSVFAPSLEVSFAKGWFVGAAYETGPEMGGTLGLYRSAARFTLSGLDIYCGYELRMKSFAVFVRGGSGLYSYKQTVDYPYVQDYPVNGTGGAFLAAAGLKFYPWKFVYLSAEAKFVALKVKPYDRSVDLGGWRLLGGLGFAFDF